MIYIGADHGGYQLKEDVKQWLTEWNVPFEDVGAHKLDPDDDYPKFAFTVAEAVAKDPHVNKGILLCRSAAGVVIAANKVKGVRAVAPCNLESAQHSREHNDANVLGLSGDWLEPETAQQIVRSWINTPFSGEARHQRRLDQIAEHEHHLYII